MGKCFDRVKHDGETLFRWYGDQLLLAYRVEEILGAELVANERVRVGSLSPGTDTVYLTVDGAEDELTDQVRRAIMPGLWTRHFNEFYGQFSYTAEAHGLTWTITIGETARGCTVEAVKETREVVRYRSVCREETSQEITQS